jgi:Gly-Xaa carboxypeptidase
MWAPVLPLAIGFSLLSTAEAFSIPLSPQQILGDLTDRESEVCPLPQKVHLDDDGLFPSIRYIQDEAILHRQVDRLSKAVQIPTAITDSMTDPNDDAFKPFVDFGYALALFFPHM